MTRAILAALAALAAGLLAVPAARAAVPEFTVSLPGDATASAVHADPSTWIVGAVPGQRSAAIAARFGARRIGLAQTGGYVVSRARARALAGSLRARGLLVYAQPNVTLRVVDGVPDDPLSGPPNAWRAFVVSPSLTPPAVTPRSPEIALVDTQALVAHPEWTNDPNFQSLGNGPVNSLHGTATAAVAVAPSNGIGILGVWPGGRAINVPLPAESITCAQSTDGIRTAIQSIAAIKSPINPHAIGVINMSYGATPAPGTGTAGICLPEYAELELATAFGIVPVAAAGNEGEQGSPLEFPSSDPHVMSIGATDASDKRTTFSNLSPALDLSAPGIGIETAVPPALDEDGVQDGYEALSGTSFSAPMVAAAVAWVEEARPHLRADQVAQVVRRSARDVGKKGWDTATGFGVLDVDRALKAKAPAHDPLEPNENIVLVNGTFGLKGRILWTGRRRAHLSATVNVWEDPLDVYRIRVPAHHRAHISATPHKTGVELRVFSSGASSVNDNRHRVGLSKRRGRATERVTVTNHGSHAHIYYVDVETQGVNVSRDIPYTLRIH